MGKTKYSIVGNYNVHGKLSCEERHYNEAKNPEEAIQMAKDDGCLGHGFVFQNLTESGLPKIGDMEKELTPVDIFGFTKDELKRIISKFN